MDKQNTIHALKVKQWLDIWDKYEYDPNVHRDKPEPYFLLFSIDANKLRLLSGIYQRTTENGLPRSQDKGIQRRHDPSRSKTIHDFIQYGYPWTEIGKTKRETGKYDNLRKPGWLPTAIVINILKPEQIRRGLTVASDDLITLEDEGNGISLLHLPETFNGNDWEPIQRHPIEIIDGQHRLFSFDDKLPDGNFELPVVAFYGLDISWQAYLFWTINITPKRINPSMAFDLYPLLRAVDWLEKFEGPIVYRQTRAQELVEAIWATPVSPWYQRINMLGDPGLKYVTQAAWINTLLTTLIKPWENKGRRTIGGLFGANIGKDETVLPWDNSQQAAFIIYAWQMIKIEIAENAYDWIIALRSEKKQLTFEYLTGADEDLAFSGENSLLNTDQGVRGILSILNDLFYINTTEFDLDLESWCYKQMEFTGNFLDDIPGALEILSNEIEISIFLKSLAKGLCKFDWRTANAVSLQDDGNARTIKLVFRGGSGYKELRRQLLILLSNEPGMVGKTAALAFKKLGYKK